MSEQNAPAQEATVESEAAPLEVQEQPVIEEAISEKLEESSSETQKISAETTEELKEEVTQAIEDGATEEQVESMIKEFNLKVNGREITKKIDLSDEDAIRKELQLALAGQEAMKDKRDLEKTYKSELDRLLRDPYGVLEELGLDPDALAENRIQQKIEQLKKSPEQIEKERIETELQQAREKLRRMEEEQNNTLRSQMEMEAQQELDTEINAALDAHKTLPKTPLTVNRIADTMLWAMENGFEDVTVGDVIPTVEKEIKDEMNTMLEQLPDEVLEQYFANKHLDRIRKRRISEVKTNNINNIKETSKNTDKKMEEKIKKKLNAKDYFRNL